MATSRCVTHFFPGFLPAPFHNLSVVIYPPGDTGTDHTHSCYQLVAVYSGVFAFHRAGQPPVVMGKNELAIVSPGIQHRWKAGDNGPCKTFAFLFDSLDTPPFEDLGRLFPKTPLAELRKTAVPREVMSGAWTGIFKECVSPRPAGTTLALAHMLRFLGEVDRATWNDSELREERQPPALRRVLDCVAGAGRAPRTLKELSREACLSPRRLTQLFQLHMGCSPINYFLQQRLKKAENLLTYSELTVGQIATELGFNSIHHFCRLFKRHRGITPSGCRKQRGEASGEAALAGAPTRTRRD